MGQFNGMTLTNQGLALQIKTIAEGKPLNVTRVALGKGTLPPGADIRAVAAVAEPVMEPPIISKEVTGDGTAAIKALVSNEHLAAGFYVREIGLFANGGDGEILYSYAYAGDNCDYIPAGGGATVINYLWTLYIIIDRITEVEAKVDANLAFATQEELQAHIGDPHAHPNLPHIGDPFGEEIEASAVKHIWADSGDGKLHKAPVPLLQKVVLGSDWANIRTYNSRLEQVEREQANLILEAELRGEYPDMNEAFAEVFIDNATVDRFSCAVSSIVAGDDSIDVDNLSGVVPGAYYTISDGANQEVVKIRSCTKAEGIHRIILAAPVVHTYAANTAMYRTTARLTPGRAEGSGTKKTVVWQPALVWQGLNASAAITVTMETTQAHAESFAMDGDIGFTADGMVTLV